MDKLEPRAIIFDLGSTLIEYEKVPWDELGVVAVENGRKYLLDRGCHVGDDSSFLRHFDEIKQRYRQQAIETSVEWTVNQVTAVLFDKIGLNHDDGLVDGFFEAYYQKVAEQLFVYDDTVETLEKLKHRYPEMGLISNTIFPGWVHERELKQFGIAPFLNFTVYSSSFGLRKPHPDIFRKAANLAGHAPQECLYVGDRYVEDIVGPRGVGMHPILKVKPDREYPEEMPEVDRRIDNLSELAEHIRL